MRTSRVALEILAAILAAGGMLLLSGYQTVKADNVALPAPANTTEQSGQPARLALKNFTPPPESEMPKDEFGEMVRLGEMIFENPAKNAHGYVGNQLGCSNCHLDAGRMPDSAPMWAAYVSYPAYRAKNKHVNTFEERLQGCFRFSMNGKAPPLGDKILVALESYAYWLAKGAPIDPNLPGRGYPKLPKSASAPDYARGAKVYAANCSLCHGANGAGQLANDGSMGFPALWGDRSFNWGAGMGDVNNAAAFIKANMPLSRGNTLAVQEAWDVALYMDSQERPQDPRFNGSVAETRSNFHDSPSSMYGITVNGHMLGDGSTPAGGILLDSARP